MKNKEQIPEPVRRRLPKYLILVQELRELEREWVSSVDISKALNLTSSTVRQDLSHFDLAGVSKKGYEINALQNVLETQLGGKTEHRVAIVGAGFLGTALARLESLPKQQFKVCSILDRNPEIVGTKVGNNLVVRAITSLPAVIANERIEIGVIAVPPESAQDVADQLVDAGVKGILNLAYVQIRVPSNIPVQDARLVADLQELAFLIKENSTNMSQT